MIMYKRGKEWGRLEGIEAMKKERWETEEGNAFGCVGMKKRETRTNH